MDNLNVFCLCKGTACIPECLAEKLSHNKKGSHLCLPLSLRMLCFLLSNHQHCKIAARQLAKCSQEKQLLAFAHNKFPSQTHIVLYGMYSFMGFSTSALLTFLDRFFVVGSCPVQYRVLSSISVLQSDQFGCYNIYHRLGGSHTMHLFFTVLEATRF